MMRAKWLLLLGSLSLAGCMSSYTPPPPSPQASADQDAQAKQFAPPEGKGNLYIQRASEFVLLGQPTPFAVTVDGKEVGGIVPGMYYCFALEPGQHTLSASAEVSIAHETVTVEAGKSYFYQITSSKAADNTVKLTLSWVAIEAMGKLMVNQSKLGQAVAQPQGRHVVQAAREKRKNARLSARVAHGVFSRVEIDAPPGERGPLVGLEELGSFVRRHRRGHSAGTVLPTAWSWRASRTG